MMSNQTTLGANGVINHELSHSFPRSNGHSDSRARRTEEVLQRR